MVMWYYTKDRTNRLGPVSDEQLRELIATRQVESADMVWREGFQTWLPIGQVPGLAPPPPAPPRPPPVPVAILPPAAPPPPPAPQHVTVPVQILQPTGPLKAELLPEDDDTPAAPKPAAAAPVLVTPVPVAVVPASAAPLAVVPVTVAVAPAPAQQPAEATSPLGGLFKKAAAAAASPKPQPTAAAPVQLAPPQAVILEEVKDGVSAHDTGDFEPEQFARCRAYLREAGIGADELIFFCNTRTRHAGVGIFHFVGSPQQPQPVLHLALTRREVALVHEGEGKKIVVDRAPHEAVSWKFAAVEVHQPSAQVEVLRLGLPSGEHELRLSPGAGLTTLKRRAAQLFQELARAHLAAGRCYYADQLLGRIEAGQLDAAELDALRQQSGAIAETAAHYRGGHPEFLDGARGVLRLDALGLEFVPTGDVRPYLRVRYEQILDILEPQRGDFPPEVVKGTEAKKSAARAVGVMSGIAGAATGTGKTVAGDLKESAAAGAPPRNRVGVVLLLDGVKQRLSFDVVAATREEMEAQAKAFWNRTASVRSRFAQAASPAPAAGGAPPHLAALRALKELLDQGVLTQEEFAQQKAVLLGPPRPARAAPAADLAPRVVGCPRCQSKLRAKKPGVVQCPKCQAKVRVAESLFSGGVA